MIIHAGIVGSGVGQRLHSPVLHEFRNITVHQINLPHRRSGSPCLDHDLSLYLPLDLVVIATPPTMHLPYVLEFANHVGFILCEKPVGTTKAGIQELLKSLKAPRNMRVNYQLRFHPLVPRIRRLLSPTTKSIELTYKSDAGLRPGPKWYRDEAMGGGPLNAVGSHLIDLVHFLGYRYHKLQANREKVVNGQLTIEGYSATGVRITTNIDTAARTAEFTMRVAERSTVAVADIIGNEICDVRRNYPAQDFRNRRSTLSSSTHDGPWRRAQKQLYGTLLTSEESNGRLVASSDTASLADALMVQTVIAAARLSIMRDGAELDVIYPRQS
jgi:predicted dehydrogenase